MTEVTESPYKFVSVRLPREYAEKVKMAAHRNNCNISDYLRKLLSEDIDKASELGPHGDSG